ncbi:MAG: hypothetical protein PVJ61_07850 [Dehalococcoidia bacterium]
MPINLNGRTYYRTAEVCQMVGISKSTLFRSLKQGIFNEAEQRDCRGWRLFSKEEVMRLKAEVNQIVETPSASVETQDSLAGLRYYGIR